MSAPPSEPDRHRRQQRRRGLIAWGSAIAAVALVAIAAVLGDDSQPRTFTVPYGETMTAAEYDTIEVGEDQADVLEGLGESGRPERLTEDYVLILFSPASEDVACSYWQFSDELQIFARLCFDRADGELVEKRARDVHGGLQGGGAGTIAA